jgi:hypothetical protein
MAEHPKTLVIYPSPDLPPGSFIPGIGVDGAELPYKEAKALLDSGAATTKKPPEPKE